MGVKVSDAQRKQDRFSAEISHSSLSCAAQKGCEYLSNVAKQFRTTICCIKAQELPKMEAESSSRARGVWDSTTVADSGTFSRRDRGGSNSRRRSIIDARRGWRSNGWRKTKRQRAFHCNKRCNNDFQRYRRRCSQHLAGSKNGPCQGNQP
jgi:hypothetical protein